MYCLRHYGRRFLYPLLLGLSCQPAKGLHVDKQGRHGKNLERMDHSLQNRNPRARTMPIPVKEPKGLGLFPTLAIKETCGAP